MLEYNLSKMHEAKMTMKNTLLEGLLTFPQSELMRQWIDVAADFFENNMFKELSDGVKESDKEGIRLGSKGKEKVQTSVSKTSSMHPIDLDEWATPKLKKKIQFIDVDEFSPWTPREIDAVIHLQDSVSKTTTTPTECVAAMSSKVVGVRLCMDEEPMIVDGEIADESGGQVSMIEWNESTSTTTLATNDEIVVEEQLMNDVVMSEGVVPYKAKKNN